MSGGHGRLTDSAERANAADFGPRGAGTRAATDASMAPRPASALLAAVTAGLLVAQQVILKASRDALFLTHFGVSGLPLMTTLGALVSALMLLGFSRVLARSSPARALPRILAVSSALLAVIWVVGLFSERSTALLVHLHTAIFGATVISSFWSVVSEAFDPHAARRYVAWITSGSALGGVAGGLAALLAAHYVRGLHLLLAVVALNVGAAVVATYVGRRSAAPSQPTPWSLAEPLRQLRKVPLLRQLGVIVAIVALLEVLFDYGMSFHAKASLMTSGKLLAFFALLQLGTGIGALLLQLVLAQRSLERLGPAGTLLFLPVATLALGATALVVPGLATSALLRGTQNIVRGSFFRSAYELFFSPIEEGQKRAAKILLDVGCDRVGVLAGSGIAALAILAGAKGPWVAYAVGGVFSVALLVAVWPLGRSYVTTLGRNIRLGTPAYDLTPLSVSRTNDAFDRHEILRHVHAVQAAETARARVVLARVHELDAFERAELIQLLRHEVLHLEAERAIAKVAPKMIGQLSDALGDAAVGEVVRRRVARILGQAGDARAVETLLAGLTDASERIQRACAVALMRIRARDPKVEVAREPVFSAIRKTLGEACDPRSASERTLAHLFALFSLAVSREAPLEATLKALLSRDERLRGTALEYLHEVLPLPVRLEAWPLLESVAKRGELAAEAS